MTSDGSAFKDAAFSVRFLGIETIPAYGCPIAREGCGLIQSSFDDCVLVMPSRQLTTEQIEACLEQSHPFAEVTDG